MKNKLGYILKLLATIGIIFALFKFVPYKDLSAAYRSSRKIYILLGLGSFYITFIACALRWKYLLARLGINVALLPVAATYISSYFLNLFFPSFVAGDIFRAVAISGHYGNVKKVASSVLMDRFSGGMALITLAVIFYFAGIKLFPQKQILFSLLIIMSIFLCVFFTIFSKRFFMLLIGFIPAKSPLRAKLVDFHEQLYFFKKNPRVFLATLAYSVVVQLFSSLGFFICAKAFGVNISVFYFLILVPIIMAIALIPITIAGMGLREGAAVYFFSLAGIDKAVGLNLSLINLIFLLSLGIFGGIVYVSIYNRCFQPGTQSPGT